MTTSVVETAEDVGGRLRDQRDRAGNPSFTTIERAVVASMGRGAPTAETIRSYHRGNGPEPAAMNIELIEALAEFYGVKVYDVSITVGDRLERLLTRNSSRRSRPRGSGPTSRYRHSPLPVTAAA